MRHRCSVAETLSNLQSPSGQVELSVAMTDSIFTPSSSVVLPTMKPCREHMGPPDETRSKQEEKEGRTAELDASEGGRWKKQRERKMEKEQSTDKECRMTHTVVGLPRWSVNIEVSEQMHHLWPQLLLPFSIYNPSSASRSFLFQKPRAYSVPLIHITDTERSTNLSLEKKWRI